MWSGMGDEGKRAAVVLGNHQETLWRSLRSKPRRPRSVQFFAPLTQQLARGLLMCEDRVSARMIDQFLATTLGVQRFAIASDAYFS